MGLRLGIGMTRPGRVVSDSRCAVAARREVQRVGRPRKISRSGGGRRGTGGMRVLGSVSGCWRGALAMSPGLSIGMTRPGRVVSDS